MQDETMALAPTAATALPARMSPLAPDELRAQIRAYRELTAVLDEELAESSVEIAGKLHRTRPFYRAAGKWAHLSVKLVSERREVFDTFADGRDNFGYLVDYIATAPDGRDAPGDGACFAVEKAESFKCPHPSTDPNAWQGKTEHYPAEACPAFDPEFEWRHLPSEASEHNVRATAHTRAYNRAISNLIGFGEVSAEEMERAPERRERGADPASASRSSTPQRGGGAIRVSEKQIVRMWTIARRCGWTEDETRALYNREGFEHAEDITRDKYDRICQRLEEGVDSGARS